MRRGVHIAISLMVVLLLLKPFDCFSSGPFTQKAAACCKKGKCVPSANSDDCCKGTLPGGKHLVASKAPDHSVIAFDLISTGAVAPTVPVLATIGSIDAEAPPGSPPVSSLNLPLRI